MVARGIVEAMDEGGDGQVSDELIVDTWKEAVLAELQELEWSGDEEQAHVRADEILCEVLARLGYEDVAAAFKGVPRWYA